jgi:hypothetical protein
MSASHASPSRGDVDAMWTAVIEGRLTREQVHAWATPLMSGDNKIDDLMVATAIQHLDGFDLTNDPDEGVFLRHGPPGEYIMSASDIAKELELWRTECAEYDADPVGWTRRALAAARLRLDEPKN